MVRRVVIGIGLLLLTARDAAAADPALKKVFDLYCTKGDANSAICPAGTLPLSDAQMRDILDGYCRTYIDPATELDEVARQKPLPAAEGTRDVCKAKDTLRMPMALEYDHRAVGWKQNADRFSPHKRRVEFDDLTQIPTAHLAKGDTIGVIISSTNPLLYAVNRGEPREDNIEQIKNLQRLLELLGGSVASLGSDLAMRAAWAGESKRLPAAAASVTRFEEDRVLLKAWTDTITESLKPLLGALRDFAALRAQVQLVAQRLERGPAVFTGVLDPRLEDPKIWSARFEALAAAANVPPQLDACAAVYDAFPGIVATAPDKPIEVHAAALGFLQLFDGATPCGELRYPPLLEAAALTIRDVAQRAARTPTPASIEELRVRQAAARETLLPGALVLHRAIRQLSATRVSTREALAKEEETRKGAMALRLMADRVREASVRKVGDLRMVSNRLYLAEEVFATSWTKIRTTPLKIALNSPYADQVPSDRPKEVSTSYRLVRRNFDRLSVAAGLVYTKAHSTTYVALDPEPDVNRARTTTVTESVPGTPPTTTTTTTAFPELKQIAEKEQQPRAGAFAFFANYRLAGSSAFGIGVQGGVAASTENPAFLGGVSINAGQWVTLGVGCGAFRIKTLGTGANGARQQLGDSVASSDDIRITNRWNRDCWRGRRDAYYAALTVNLSGLPIFSPK